MMESFYFGEKSKLLYGIYHAPQPSRTADLGVILCYPLGQEYIRCHRAFLQLAKRLTSMGCHVLRFDYYGSGDSLGESDEGDLIQWRTDITSAIAELKEGAEVSRICLIGLRLGATLAWQVAAEHGSVDYLVLWDPVSSGSCYLKEQSVSHKRWLAGSFARPQKHECRQTEILGFSVTEALSQQIETVELFNFAEPLCKDILLIRTSPGTNIRSLSDRLTDHDLRCHYLDIPTQCFWIHDGNETSKGLVPTDILNHITAWVTNCIP